MRFKALTFLVFLVLSFFGFGQDEARGSIAKNISPATNGVKRALIVGISDYQSDAMKLNFADDDAAFFKDYLSNVEQIPDSRLAYLTDDEAISFNIMVELKKLMTESQAGDTVYLFFAGHGDVVDDFGDEEGFLLAADVNEDRNYYGTQGVVPLKIINRVITKVTEKGAKVILVLDACRSGFLYKEGAQKNLETFNNNFQNSTKFLSCGPDQLSYESKEIGHGFFTYYLVLGLMGAADHIVQDNKIQYFELEMFLDSNVKLETNDKQVPVVWNQKATDVFREITPFDKEFALNEIKNSSNVKNALASRGVSEVTEASESITENLVVQQFNEALSAQNYYGNNESALEVFYRGEKENLVAAEVSNRMRYTIVNALSSNAQLLINTYIGGAEVLPNGDTFISRAKDLEICLSLLDIDDFGYDRFLTSKLFLEAYSVIRSRNYSNYPLAKKKLEEALVIEDRAAYIHNALGIILNHEEQYELAQKHYDKAKELIPTWSFPVNNSGGNFLDKYQYRKAKNNYEKALELKGSYGTALNNLGVVSERQGEYHKAEFYYLRAKEVEQESATAIRNLGNLYRNRGNIRKAITFYKEALAKDSLDVYTYYSYSDLLNDNNINTEKAESLLKKAIKLEPYFSRGHAEYADLLRRYPRNENSLKEADSLYDFAIKNDPFYAWGYAGRAWLYHKQKQTDKALASFHKGIDVNSYKARPYYYLANYYGDGLKNNMKAEEYYKKAIAIDSFYLPAYEKLVSIYYKTDKTDKSLALINDLLKWNSDAPDAFNLLGRTYFARQEYNKAIDAFNQTLEIDSTYAKGYTNLSYSLAQTGNYKEAAVAFKSANKFNPYKNNVSTFVDLLLNEARKMNRENLSNDAEDLLVIANSMEFNLKSNFALAEHYYLNDESERANELFIYELMILAISDRFSR